MVDHEVIDQTAVLVHRLCPDASGERLGPSIGECGDIGGGRSDEALSRQYGPDLKYRRFDVPGGESPETGAPGDCEAVGEVDVPSRIVLPPEGEESIGADKGLAADVLRHMDPEERVGRIRHRVDEAIDQVG